MSDTDFQFQIEPCYNAGQLKLRRINPAPLPTPAYHEPPPDDVHLWLSGRGWIASSSVYTSSEYAHPNYLKPGTMVMRGYTWEQAMAIEFYKFINIGSEG